MNARLSIVAALLCALPLSASAERRMHTRSTSAMGTEVRISVLTEDEERATSAIEEAFAEIRRLEAIMTTWRADSEISRINAQAGKAPVVVSTETFEVLEMAARAAALSKGAFDVSFYALRGLWKFDEDLESKVPRAAEIRRRLPLIDYKKVVLDRKARSVFLARPGMAINLGGIAKGYAVDRAVAVLRRHGLVDAIVQAGGDLMCSGSKGGLPWTAGVRDPRGGRGDVFALLKLKDHAFSTAGDYERYFHLDGKRYHHIIDPRTGRPATRSRSVTVYAPTALLADALDDAIFILGWRRGFRLLEGIDDVGAVVIDSAGAIHVSPRMKERVEIRYTPRDEP